jgi:cbb3-type cytochrome oxidase maturation protein
MIVILLIIILSILVAGGFLAGFIWCVRSGQFEDTCTPSMRMLLDDATPEKPGHASPADRPALSGGQAKDVAP